MAHSLLLSAHEVPLRVRRIKRARSITLHWRPLTRDALLTLPARASMASALAFAESRKAWLQEQINEHGRRVPFAGGAVIPLLGEPHTLRHRPDLRGVVFVQEGEIIVCGAAEFISRRTRDWLIACARAEIETRAHAKARIIGKRVRRIGLRDTASRWGSCASGGVLSFSWRLVFAPESVLDYVVSHEVAHLAHMNHSARFWRVVAELCPQHEAARKWMSRHGQTLYAYG